jgi:membrane protease YdiL (CAAX protease family)
METVFSHTKTILSISLVIISFAFYFFVSTSLKLKSILNNFFGTEQGQLRFILIQRTAGIFFFGIVPVIVYMLSGFALRDFGFVLKFDSKALFIVLILGSLIILMNYFAARSEQNLSMYPQIRKEKWSLNLLLLSALSWMAYLLAYEILFRGILLFSCYNELGALKAVIINVIIYVLVHLPKGPKEAIGAVPLGIVLCLISMHFGTFWAAFWIHCFLALSNEWFSIKYSTNIKIIRN